MPFESCDRRRGALAPTSRVTLRGPEYRPPWPGRVGRTPRGAAAASAGNVTQGPPVPGPESWRACARARLRGVRGVRGPNWSQGTEWDVKTAAAPNYPPPTSHVAVRAPLRPRRSRDLAPFPALFGCTRSPTRCSTSAHGCSDARPARVPAVATFYTGSPRRLSGHVHHLRRERSASEDASAAPARRQIRSLRYAARPPSERLLFRFLSAVRRASGVTGPLRRVRHAARKCEGVLRGGGRYSLHSASGRAPPSLVVGDAVPQSPWQEHHRFLPSEPPDGRDDRPPIARRYSAPGLSPRWRHQPYRLHTAVIARRTLPMYASCSGSFSLAARRGHRCRPRVRLATHFRPAHLDRIHRRKADTAPRSHQFGRPRQPAPVPPATLRYPVGADSARSTSPQLQLRFHVRDRAQHVAPACS